MQIVETTSCSANLFTIAQAHWLVSGVFQEKQYSLWIIFEAEFNRIYKTVANAKLIQQYWNEDVL